VYAIDARRHDVVARIATGKRPRSVAFSPDGVRAYVTAELDGSVTVVDAVRHARLHDVSLRGRAGDAPRPMGVVVSPDGARVYVTTGRARAVAILDAGTSAVVGVIPDVGDRPWGIGITRDGSKLYVANGPSNDVAVVDTERRRVVKRLRVGASPWGIALAPR
jgi:YVTN family beta-propeller protein